MRKAFYVIFLNLEFPTAVIAIPPTIPHLTKRYSSYNRHMAYVVFVVSDAHLLGTVFRLLPELSDIQAVSGMRRCTRERGRVGREERGWI